MNKPLEIEGEEMAGKKGPKKKAYTAPRMVEYGNVAKLTQGGTGTVGDAQGMNMAPCL
jgi:hypothetical protein